MRTNPALGPNDFLQELTTGSLIWNLLAKLVEIHGHTPFGEYVLSSFRQVKSHLPSFGG